MYTNNLYAVTPGAPAVLSKLAIRGNCTCSGLESLGCSCFYERSSPTILQNLDLYPVNGAEPVRNLWSVAFSNARGTLIGCAPCSTSAFATRVLEIDPATGNTTVLASVIGSSVRDVCAIQDSFFFFLIATRQGKELIRLSLDTLEEDKLFLPQLQHLVHLSWDDRRNQLLGVSVSQAAVSVVKSTGRMRAWCL